MAERLYNYGVIFWNEATDEEICAYFLAPHYLAAERYAKPYFIPGFVKGAVSFIEDKDKAFYNQPLESVAQKEVSNDN